MMIPKIVPVTEFRSQVLRAVRRAQNKGQEYVITTNGEPAAVLISFDEWESLMETLEIKQDKKLMSQIKKNKRHFDRGGKGKSIEEIDWS